MNPADAMIRPAGGPGESPVMECPIRDCWWVHEIVYSADLRELLALARDHMSNHDDDCDHDNLTPDECPVCHER